MLFAKKDFVAVYFDCVDNPTFGVACSPKAGTTLIEKWLVKKHKLEHTWMRHYNIVWSHGFRRWIEADKIAEIGVPVYAITRCPIRRFASVLANRIYDKNKRNRSLISSRLDPNEIALGLHSLRDKCVDFKWHTERQTEFIGQHAYHYSEVFDISQMTPFMNSMVGESLHPENPSTSHQIQFSDEATKYLRSFYAGDFMFIKRAINRVDIGEYVLATKYDDGDPCDHFFVGFVSEYTWHDRYIVVDNDGKSARANGFRRAEVITKEEGHALVAKFPEIGDRPGKSLWWHLNDIRQQSNANA